MHHLFAKDLAQWRVQARDMLARHVLPLDVTWDESMQASMFATVLPSVPEDSAFTVPPDFLPLA